VQPPTPVRRAVSEKTAALVVSMMEGVTEEGGTAIRARVPGYRVAGKTGTAQKVEDGHYGSGRIGSFVGLVPADQPVLAIVVSVDDPQLGSHFGGIVAAPAFAAIAGQSLRYLGVPPDPALLAEDPSDPEGLPAPPVPPTAVSPRAAPDPELPPLRVSWAGQGWSVPDLRGRALREVVASLGPTGLGLSLSGSGAVVRQDPAPGSVALPGSRIALVLR